MRALHGLLTLMLSVGAVGCAEDDAAAEAGEQDMGARDAAPPEPDAQAPAISPIPLTATLCEDPANMERLGDPMALFGDAGFGEVQADQIRRMAEAPTEGPFYMVNLVRFRAQAQYPDGRETSLTGREANALYQPVEFLSAIGARPVFVGEVGEVLIGEAGSWEQVAIVEYPCPVAFFAMLADPGFRARSIHKDAGVEASIVMAASLQPTLRPEGFEPPESPFPPTAEEPAFEMIHVLRYHAQAMYEEGSGEPARTGREAMHLYSSGAEEAADRVGVYPTAWFEIQGVVIGDGRPWDEVRLNYMPSRAGFNALVMDPTRLDGQHHRNAAIEETYSLITYPALSAIPGAPGR